jgi:hypothetical protein
LPDAQKRLDSWKEIAGYLGKDLSQKTAQRWEKSEGLPVYREGARVFAYADELDRWKAGRVVAPASESIVAVVPPAAGRRKQRLLLGVLLGGSVVVIALMVSAVLRVREIPPAAPIRIGRFLARMTSEDSGPPPRIQLDHIPEFLALTPDGSKLYVSSASSPTLSVLRTADGSVRKLTLPKDGGPLAVSPDGHTLYVGFLTYGIAVVDVGSDSVRSVISTPGPVFSLSFTPDGTKLFLAMSKMGVWRMLAATRELRQITSQQCPEHLQVGGPESRLYVTFQCGNVAGHDPLEVFDSRTERSVGQLQGPPMVGGYPDVSPDGKWLLLDGLDACMETYPHSQGCPDAPGRIYHLVRTGDLQIERTLTVPARHGGLARFIDRDRILILGDQMSVVDRSQGAESERWESPSESFDSLVLQGDHRKAYAGIFEKRQILILTAAGSECTPPSEDLVSWYPGDGVATDVVGRADLTASGAVRYGPGRVGQAFVFDGKSGHLRADSTGHFRFGHRPSSMAVLVKFARVDGEMAILDRTFSETAVLARLIKAADNRLRFDFALKQGGPVRLASKAPVEAGRWYHVCVTRSDTEVRLYVDGVLQDSRALSAERTADVGYENAPLYLGATGNHHAFFDGKLDEVLFYRRALSSEEVLHLFQLGQESACRM